MKIGYKQLLEDARKEIKAISAKDAIARQGDETVVFVDLRDIRELQREGMISGAFHAPRGMLEFWVDPESPYHKEIFASGKQFVFYCASGWRSALATQTMQRMGLAPVMHIEGGFTAWREAGGTIVKKEEKKPG
jgi:rhodanese-related sulfurtransferase